MLFIGFYHSRFWATLRRRSRRSGNQAQLCAFLFDDIITIKSLIAFPQR